MTEPRMRARVKGQQFATDQLEDLLYAFGSPIPPLPETIRILDSLLTDFIIELCHTAALSAQLAHRAKIKPDDFRFALRKDAKKLGRVTEMGAKEKAIKNAKQAFKSEVVAEGIVGGMGRGRGRGGGKRGREELREEGEGSDGEGIGEDGARGRKKRKGRRMGGKSRVKSEGVEEEEDDDDEDVGEE